MPTCAFCVVHKKVSSGGVNSLSPSYLCCVQVPGHAIKCLGRHSMSDLFSAISTTHCCGKSNSIILILGVFFLGRGDENHADLSVLGVCGLCVSVLVGGAAWSCCCVWASHAFPALLLTCLQLLLLFVLALQYPNPLLYCRGCMCPAHPL